MKTLIYFLAVMMLIFGLGFQLLKADQNTTVSPLQKLATLEQEVFRLRNMQKSFAQKQADIVNELNNLRVWIRRNA